MQESDTGRASFSRGGQELIAALLRPCRLNGREQWDWEEQTDSGKIPLPLFPAKMLVYFHVNTAYHSINVDELPLFTPVSVAGESLLCDRDAGCGPTEPSFLTVSSGRASPRPTALDHRSR